MKKNKLIWTLSIGILIVLIIIEIFPIFWIILNSFKSYGDIVYYPPKFIFKPIIDNYIYAITKTNFLYRIMDSFIITFISVFIAIFAGSLAAYGIIRLKVGGYGFLLLIISSRMLPGIALLIPLFTIFMSFGIKNTYITLILTYSTLSLSFIIWQMSSFLKEIPKEIEEAAIIDGCNLWQVFFKVIMPISKPGLTAVGIFSFLGIWNEFLFASIFSSANIMTAPVAAAAFVTDRIIPWGPMASACVMTLIPSFIFILIVQKQMVEGLTMGAVKG